MVRGKYNQKGHSLHYEVNQRYTPYSLQSGFAKSCGTYPHVIVS